MKIVFLVVITLSIASMGYKPVSRVNPAHRSVVGSDLSRENCVEEEFNYTSTKECHCYLFQSAGRSSGNFKSPKYPSFYPANVGCILYIFIGAVDELVELTLTEFDMRPRAKDKRCLDHIRLFLNLDRPEVSANDPWDFENCGQMKSLAQSVFYSRHRVIIIEFHSTGRLGRNYRFRGFKGNFNFVKRTKYKIDGDPIAEHPCRYHFYSESLTSGRFFSPNYPQNYPPNSACLYEFFGEKHQRVIVDFLGILLEPEKKCDPISAGDRVVVYDGDWRQERILDRYCGRLGPRQVVSHGPRMTIRLFADGDGVQGQGFSAKFQFVNRHTVQPSRVLDDTMRGDGQVTRQSPCSKEFRSSVEHKSGLFELPETPYPPKFTCVFTFRGQAGERVTLDFRLVQLDDASTQWCRSHTGDRIEIYDGMSDAQKWLAVICGQVEHRSVTSSGPSLTVKFVADDISSSAERGFQASYSFLREDEMSKELSTPAKEGSGPSTVPLDGSCRHQIISHSKEKSGVLQTPGYPNGFKKDIVCYWLFYGAPNERIRIKFLDFSLNKERDLLDSLNGAFLPRDSCAGRDRVQLFKFYYQEAIGQVTRHDAPVEFCGDADPQFVMSGQRSRLDLIFHSVGGSRGSARGIRFRYKFISDFGVTATGAVQKPGECSFHFSGLKSTNGSFTSPNYPGRYPEDLNCDYVFSGHAQQRISVSFADFDVASVDPNADCSGSPGDYIEAIECYASGYRILRPEYVGPRRFCRRPRRGQFYRIDWPNSCLHLRFHSNSVDTKRGFFAYYSFYFDSEYVSMLEKNGVDKLPLHPLLTLFTVAAAWVRLSKLN